MPRVVLRTVPSAIDARALVSYLESVGVDATSRSFDVALYPGVVQPPGDVVEILVDEADVEAARAHLEAYDASTVDEDELTAQALAAPSLDETRGAPRLRAKRLTLFGAMALSIVFNVYAAYFMLVAPWLRNEQVDVDIEGRVVAIQRYTRGAWFPVEVDVFDRDGNKTSTWFDRDEDGWQESGRYSVSRPRPGGATHFVLDDTDHDGRWDTTTVYRDAAVLSRRIDRNADELDDEWTHEATGSQLVDDDHDGFPERFICRMSASRFVELSLLSCPTAPL